MNKVSEEIRKYRKPYQVQVRGKYCKSYRNKEGASFDDSKTAWIYIERMEKIYPRKFFRVVEKFNPHNSKGDS